MARSSVAGRATHPRGAERRPLRSHVGWAAPRCQMALPPAPPPGEIMRANSADPEKLQTLRTRSCARTAHDPEKLQTFRTRSCARTRTWREIVATGRDFARRGLDLSAARVM